MNDFIYVGLGTIKMIYIWGLCAAILFVALASITLLTQDKAWLTKLIRKVTRVIES